MKLLCKMAGGSHAYGLNTPASDYDERYVFLHEDIANIIGLGKNEFVDKRNDTEDSFGFEMRHFLSCLRKTNTQVFEILFTHPDKFISIDPTFVDLVMSDKTKLIDAKYFYKSLKGYIQNEKRLANGERQGKLGGKRREALDQFGFSPKNFVQLFRLAWCGEQFFKTGIFPVDIKEANPDMATWLLDLKTNPGAFDREMLNKLVDTYEADLDNAYAVSKILDAYSFDVDYANNILLQLYYPVLLDLYYNNPVCLKSSKDSFSTITKSSQNELVIT